MASVGDINTITLPNGNTYDIRDTNAVPMTGATSSAAGASGLVPAPTSSDATKFLRGDGTWGDGGMPMVILSYGNSTWSDFINAYNNNVIVYCRASSSANPASGSQTRMAFMAYVNNATNPTEVEFQYYRSVSSHNINQQGDQVFVYKLTSASKWTVTTREAMARIVAGTNMSSTYSNNVLTINGNYSAMTGASSSAAGATGLVPAPATGDNEKFLRGDGTWAEAGGTVDSDLSTSSTNPVQNSTITNALSPIIGSTPAYEEITGKYIANTGIQYDNAQFSCSEPIPIEKDDVVILTATGYGQQVAMITLSNSDGTQVKPVVISTDSDEHVYTYTSKENGYYIISYKISGSAKHELIQYTKNSLIGVEQRTTAIENLNLDGLIDDFRYQVLSNNVIATMSDEGHFIQYDGSYQSSSNYYISSSITLPANSTIKFNAMGYQTNVAVLAKVNNSTYTSLVASYDNNEHEFIYTTFEEISVVISSHKTVIPIYSIYTSRIDTIDGRLTQTESNKADKTDTVLLTTLSRGRKANSTVGTGSLAFGDDVKASGSYTHAEGNLTSASGAYTHAEGIGSEASSRGSHAEGFGASATAYYAHAEGCGTTAKSKSQHVAGEYNVLDPTGGASTTGTYVEIVGNGTGHGNRSNARALDWNGNEYLMGDVYVECGANSTGGTKIPSASFTGATSVTDGANGWVPAPLTGEQDKFLKGDGTWKVTQGDAFVKANDLDSIISDKVNAIKGPYTEEDVIHSAMIFNSGAIVEGSYAEFVSPLIPISSGMYGLKVIHSPTTTALGNIDAGNNYNNGFGFFASDGTTVVTRPSLMQDLGNDIYLFEVPVSASYVRFGVRENNADYLSDAIAYFNQWILLPNADNTITDDFFTIAQQKQGIDIDHLFRADGSRITLVDAVARSMTQVGEIRLFSGTTAPSKWKLCDGSVISREDYGDLFTAIGTTYGGGDGSTTFAIPDFKGRSPVGVGESAATGHTAHTLGQYDGEEKHTLTTAELANHRHSAAFGTWDGGHSGIVTFDSSACYYNSWNGTTQSIGATGSNTAHNTMQPYTGINFIIYTGIEEIV